MPVTPLENFYLKQGEPTSSCLQALRQIILQQHKNITEAWKYGMPFFCYEGIMFCYLSVHKKYKQPYIGFVEGKQLNHPLLLQEKRSRMKILLINAVEDLPMELIEGLLKEAIGKVNLVK